MFKLLPSYKLITYLVTAVILLLLAIEDLLVFLIGMKLSDFAIARYLSLVLVAFLGVVLGTNWKYASWRGLWTLVPRLNQWAFPDLNGVWVGSTSSNWPRIQYVHNAATSRDVVSDADVSGIPCQSDKIAVRIEATFFSVKVTAATGSTGSLSRHLIVGARRRTESETVQLSYVYKQETPVPAHTDEQTHIGAANLEFDPHNLDEATGLYWTTRAWQTGKNTAGVIELKRVSTEWVSDSKLKGYLGDPASVSSSVSDR